MDVFIYYAVFTTKKDTVFFLSNQLLWYTFFIFIADVKSCCCFAETSVKIYDIFWEEPSAILHFSGRKSGTTRHRRGVAQQDEVVMFTPLSCRTSPLVKGRQRHTFSVSYHNYVVA